LAEPKVAARVRANLPLRVEDVLLAGWVAIASPIFFKLGGDKGPFEANQPLEGLLRLGAVAGVVVCLAARQRMNPADPTPTTLINRGAMGPFIGGILLITIGGFTALNASSQAVVSTLVVTAIAAVAVRFAAPPLSVPVRRALVSPYVLVAAGLYWTIIESTIGSRGAAAQWQHALLNPGTNQLILLFLVGFSAVYYAMLIFAPRQLAEREGGKVEWLVRYLAFMASVVFGVGWLGLLGT
jgi:hypothetical protein